MISGGNCESLAPMLFQHYAWSVWMSDIIVAIIFLRGRPWLSSMQLRPMYPGVSWLNIQRERSDGIFGGTPPVSFSSCHFLNPVRTFPGIWGGTKTCQFSGPAYCLWYPYPTSRGLKWEYCSSHQNPTWTLSDCLVWGYSLSDDHSPRPSHSAWNYRCGWGGIRAHT